MLPNIIRINMATHFQPPSLHFLTQVDNQIGVDNDELDILLTDLKQDFFTADILR